MATALLSGTAASATVLTVALGMPAFSGGPADGAPVALPAATSAYARYSVDGATPTMNVLKDALAAPAATQAPTGAELQARAPEPETYALILAGLLFVGLRMRSERRKPPARLSPPAPRSGRGR
ncbi:PEP-CTERM sorting domain-containing protein [Roseateles sp.]|uniref:PEP-CTERM sorting domain-containing protein n=1 Tax=Roseateles sp. TaxID=1971397 RepID=UPI00326771AB